MAKTKTFYGLFQDGENYKAAKLVLEDETLYLEGLYSTGKSNSSASQNENDDEDSLGFDNDFLAAFDFEEKKEPEPETESYSLENELKESLGGLEESSSFDTKETDKISKIKSLIEENYLFDGRFSLNQDISNVVYKRMEMLDDLKHKKCLKFVENTFNEDGGNQLQIPSKYHYFNNSELELVGIQSPEHQSFLEDTISSAHLEPKRKIEFDSIQTNEIALMNAVRYNFDVQGSGLIAIFYVGIEESRVLLMDGESFHSALPIINEGVSSSEILQTMYSRYLLERSHTELPPLQKIFVAGESIDNTALDFIREHEEEIEISRLLPRMVEGSSDFSEDQLCEFIIPIMLAVRSAYPKNEFLIQTNFIPKSILDQQNSFSIGIPGFILIALIFASIFFGFQDFTKWYFKNEQKKQDIKRLKITIAEHKAIVDSILAMEKEIRHLENNIGRVKQIIGEKNQWHFVLEEISKSYISNPLSWATNLKKQENNFRLQGSTTIRKNIVSFSQLFPNGKIEKVNRRKIEDYTIWDFDILFAMPDPVVTKRLDFQREGVLYQSAKKLVETKPEPVQIQVKNPQPKVPEVQPQEDINPQNVITKSDDLYQEALSLYRKGKLEESIQIFNSYIHKNDDLYVLNAKYYIGESYYRLGNIAEAEPLLKEVLNAGKRKVPESLYFLGNVAMKKGNTSEAIQYWKNLKTQYPSSDLTKLVLSKIDKIEG